MPDKITKFIQSLNDKVRKQLKSRLSDLAKNPYSAKGVKKMSGCENTFRLRMGKIRVIFTIIEGSVEIIDIDYRGNIY